MKIKDCKEGDILYRERLGYDFKRCDAIPAKYREFFDCKVVEKVNRSSIVIDKGRYTIDDIEKAGYKIWDEQDAYRIVIEKIIQDLAVYFVNYDGLHFSCKEFTLKYATDKDLIIIRENIVSSIERHFEDKTKKAVRELDQYLSKANGNICLER